MKITKRISLEFITRFNNKTSPLKSWVIFSIGIFQDVYFDKYYIEYFNRQVILNWLRKRK